MRLLTEKNPFVEWLQALDLAQITITATIDPSGNLGSVGGLWPKLLAAAKDAAALGLLRVVLVAEEQSDVPEGLEKEDAFPLRIIRADTLQEAVEKLYEEHGPRDAVRRYEREQCALLEILDNRVPIEKHYQVLPLLREVKRERLPRDPRRTKRGEEAAESGLRPIDILRWEEELREERVTYERVSLEQVFNSFQSAAKEAKSPVPRFVVLGPPGSGKTTMEQYLALQAADGQLCVFERHLVPARVRLREWEAWAVKPVDPEASLPEYLTECYKDLKSAPTLKHWRQWLLRGDVLLLLDGLDEVADNPSFKAALRTALTLYKDCPTVLTCRTVSFEEHRGLCPAFPLFILAGLDDTQRDAYIRAFPAEHPERFNPESLIDQLSRTPQMRPLEANPLLLSLICFVVDDPHGVTLPAVRGELYDKTVEKLLMRPRRVKVNPDLPVMRKRRILERAALCVFAGMDERRQLTFDEGRLLDALTKAAKLEGYRADPATVADALLADLTQNSGILRGSAEQGYFFLHLTVQEFLAAAALARLVNEIKKGWKSKVELGQKTCTVLKLVDKKAWDPRWQEVIVLLAGILIDPLPLLELLSDPDRDDFFRHRLCLAARCLPELPKDAQHSLVERIGENILDLWLEHRRRRLPRFPHIAQSLSALARSSPAVGISKILKGLHGGDKAEPALSALREMGPAAAYDPEVLPALLAALRNDSPKVRFFAVHALGDMKEVAARHPGVLPTLVKLVLHEKDRDVWNVQLGAAVALGEIGEAAARHPDVLPTLVAALHDKDGDVRHSALSALREMGEAGARHPDVLPTLVRIAQLDRDEAARECAVWALGLMGDVAARYPGVLPTLLKFYLEKGTRYKGLIILGRMAEAAACHSEVLPTLVAGLHDIDGDVRARAADALMEMGEAAGRHPEVIPTLLRTALHDCVPTVRSSAAGALGEVGEVAAHHPGVLPALARIALNDEDRVVRSSAAEALGKMGEVAARHPEVVPRLVAALREGGNRFSAVDALGKIGEAAARHPEVLPTLVAFLHAKEWSLRSAAAKALGQIGEAVARHPEVLSALVGLVIHDENEFVQTSADRALSEMGEAAARHLEVLPILLNRALYGNKYAPGPITAAHALGQIMAHGVRIFTEQGRWTWKSVEELAKL